MTTPSHVGLTVTIGHAILGWHPLVFAWGLIASLPDVFVWWRYKFGAAARWAYYDTYHEIGSLLPSWLRLVFLPVLWPYELHCASDDLVHRPEGGIYLTRYILLEAAVIIWVISYWVSPWLL